MFLFLMTNFLIAQMKFQLSNFLLKHVIALLCVSFFFSHKIMYKKLVDVALNIVFGRKQLEYATCGRVFFSKTEKRISIFKNKRIRADQTLVLFGNGHGGYRK